MARHVTASNSSVHAGVEHHEKLEPCSARDFVVFVLGLGRCPFRVVEEVVDVFVEGLDVLVSVLANNRWWEV